MSIAEFLFQLRESGIELRLEDDRLICHAPKGAATQELMGELKRKKVEIIDFLSQVSPQKWSTLIPIQPHGNKIPFFCFHGVGGNVLNYKVLISYLGPDQPLYGLQSIGLDGITPPLKTIEEMAARYLEEIRDVQPHGPYCFGGGSMGGMVALEAAQQVQREGEEIGILVMFDTIGPNHGIKKSDRLLHRLRNNSLKDLYQYGVSRITEGQEDKNNMETCFSYQKRGEPIPHDLRIWFVRKMNFAAMARYDYTVFDGEVTLIKGSDEKSGIYSDPKRGWENMTTKGLKIYEVPGHHDTLVEEPLLGKQLAACLEECHRGE